MADDQAQQPMILVKKPDGTSVRVPLSSLQGTKNKEQGTSQVVGEDQKVRRSESGTATQQPVDTSVVQSVAIEHVDQKMLPPEPPQMLLEESYQDDEASQEPGITAPRDSVAQREVVQQPVNNVSNLTRSTQNVVRSTSQWSADDHLSPLTEVLQTQTPHEVSSIRGEDQVVAFLSTSSVPIKPELRGRTIALLSSLLKGVRSSQQVMEYAVKAVETGGLQLSDVEARSLVQQAQEYFHLRPGVAVARRSPSNTTSLDSVYVSQPQISRTVPKPTYAPVHESGVRPRVTDIILPPAIPAPHVSQSEIHAVPPETPLVVEPMGPVEEIQTFTKDDFRRLSANPKEAAHMLLLQMQHVSEESPLLGLSVRRAWFLSPLYTEYLGMLADSLENGFSIADIAQDANSLTKDEVLALLDIHRACEEV